MKLLKNLPKIDEVSKGLAIKNAIAMDTGELIYFSGYAGIDLDKGILIEGPIEDHINGSLDCYQYILEHLGLSFDNVIKVNCFLADPVGDFPKWNEIFKERFKAPHPCRTTVGAPLVVGKIEIEIIAAKTSRLDAEII
ncbi:RidA family protein [Ciceribacter selenitireducens]